MAERFDPATCPINLLAQERGLTSCGEACMYPEADETDCDSGALYLAPPEQTESKRIRPLDKDILTQIAQIPLHSFKRNL